jgi:Tfp pilus assembly protein PilV
LKIKINKKGISMVEVLIAMFLTMIAVVSLSSMVPLSWRTAGKSDYLGRATSLLQNELEWRQYQTMRGVDPITLEYSQDGQPVLVGDTTFIVKTSTSKDNARPNTWLINVNVTWPGNDNGVTSSIIATRQMGFNNMDTG